MALPCHFIGVSVPVYIYEEGARLATYVAGHTSHKHRGEVSDDGACMYVCIYIRTHAQTVAV